MNDVHGIHRDDGKIKAIKDLQCKITSDAGLCHFNPDLPLILTTDASPVGLEALISDRFPDGRKKTIAFTSRSPSKAEKNYSQIHKEAIGIYWGLKKCFPYCYIRQLTLITDHKPLVVNLDKSLPSMCNTTLQLLPFLIRVQLHNRIKTTM